MVEVAQSGKGKLMTATEGSMGIDPMHREPVENSEERSLPKVNIYARTFKSDKSNQFKRNKKTE